MRVLFFLSFLLFALLPGQNIRILYNLKYLPVAGTDKFENELMALDISQDKKESVFYSYAKKQADSIYQKISSANDREQTYLRSIVPSQSFHFIIVKPRSADKNIVFEKFDSQLYRYEQPFDSSWRIGTKSKRIFNYSCKNATISFGGRIWEAWFTEEIPISDGPYKFRGLPGMILQLGSTDGEYLFTMVALQKNKAPLAAGNDAVNIKTYEQSLELKKKYAQNPSARSRQEDMMYKVSGESIINGKKYSPEESYRFLDNELWDWMKQHTNPIEKGDVWVR